MEIRDLAEEFTSSDTDKAYKNFLNKAIELKARVRFVLWRVRKRKKYVELCRRVGVSYVTMSNWELGRSGDLGIDRLTSIVKVGYALLEETN